MVLLGVSLTDTNPWTRPSHDIGEPNSLLLIIPSIGSDMKPIPKSYSTLLDHSQVVITRQTCRFVRSSFVPMLVVSPVVEQEIHSDDPERIYFSGR